CGNGCRPQAGWDGRVGEPQQQRVRFPPGRQPFPHLVPGVGRADGQVRVALGVEGQASGRLALRSQVLLGKRRGNGSEEVTQRHGASSGGQSELLVQSSCYKLRVFFPCNSASYLYALPSSTVASPKQLRSHRAIFSQRRAATRTLA